MNTENVTDTAATVIIGQKVRSGSEQPYEECQSRIATDVARFHTWMPGPLLRRMMQRSMRTSRTMSPASGSTSMPEAGGVPWVSLNSQSCTYTRRERPMLRPWRRLPRLAMLAISMSVLGRITPPFPAFVEPIDMPSPQQPEMRTSRTLTFDAP